MEHSPTMVQSMAQPRIVGGLLEKESLQLLVRGRELVTEAERIQFSELGGGRDCSSGGCGYTEANQNGTNKALQGGSQSGDRRDMGRLLDVVMPSESSRYRAKTVAFNPDPKVADYKNAEEIMKIFMGDF